MPSTEPPGWAFLQWEVWEILACLWNDAVLRMAVIADICGGPETPSAVTTTCEGGACQEPVGQMRDQRQEVATSEVAWT